LFLLNRAANRANPAVGSYANSLHVKCDDSDRVADAIDRLVKKAGWRPTDQPPAEEDCRWGASGSRRAILVSAPVFGWVSVLDSDLAGEFQLASQLAEALNAYSLIFLVNDSDSWGYCLARGDGPLDSFRMDDDEATGSAPVSISEAEAQQLHENLAKIQGLMSDGTFMQRVQELQNKSIASAPPEIRAIHERLQRHEATTPEELTRFAEWNRANKPLMEQIEQTMRELLQMPDLVLPSAGPAKKKRKRKPTKAERAAAFQRIENLRPLFVTEATDEQVQELLDRKAVFAEETLAEFLPLFGIPPFYAYLDYGHHTEASPEELSTHSVRFVHHLKYETDLRTL
jgi:hypothetical protein